LKNRKNNKTKNIEKNLGIFYAFHSEELRKIIPMTGFLEFEKKMGKRRVDIYIQEKYYDVYIEMQIYDSDKSHLNQVLKIIENEDLIDNSKILWVATGFDPEHLREVKIALNKSKIKLEFMALQISNEMVDIIEDFANVETIDSLAYLKEYDDTKLLEKYSNEGTLEDRMLSYNRLANKEQELVRFYIEPIRRVMPQFLSAWNGKQLSGRMISFGLIFDVAIRFGLDRYNNLTVTVSFAYSQFRLYRDLFICGHIIDEKLEKVPTWDTKNHKLYYSIPYNEEDKDSILEKQVKVLKDYVDVFTKLAEHRNEIITASEQQLEPLVANILDIEVHRTPCDILADIK